MATLNTKSTLSNPANRQRGDLSRYISIRPASGAIFVILTAICLHFSNIDIPIDMFLVFHLVAELSSIVVCFVVFSTAYYGFQQTKNQSDLMLGLVLALTGFLDLIHTLSYKGMPDFISVNTTGLAAAYWVAARLVFGLGICLACLIKPGSRYRLLQPVWGITIIATMGLMIVVAFTTFGPKLTSALYDERTATLTTLKVSLEILCIAVYIIGINLLRHRKGWDKRTVVLLQTALLIAISAELFFCWYRSPYAWYNATGHILKSIAYLCILNALFVSALHKPYSELSKARYRLRDLYKEARNSRNEIETSFSRIGMALSASVRVSEAAGIVARLAREISRSDCAVIRIGSTTEIDAQQTCSGNFGPCPQLLQLAEHYGRQAVAAHETVSLAFAENEMKTLCVKGDVHPIRHQLSVCLIHESRVLGTISLFRRTDEEYRPRDIKLVNAFAYHAGIAISNAHSYEREQHIASILQESITKVASVAGEHYDIGHFYKPLLEEASVGGDFLDVIKLPEGKIGLAIGDVAGKGLRAAVHTAMLKYALRAFLSEGHSPAEATQRLENLVLDFVEDDKFITLFVAVLDTRTGMLSYTNAGHEPPILCKSNICGNLTPTGPALGLGCGQQFLEKTVCLEPKDILVIFTDGLTERGGGHPDFSVDRVAHILIDNNAESCDSLVDSIYQASRSSESGELRDDVAVLAIKAL